MSSVEHDNKKNSIQIYHYKKELQLTHDLIEEKISGDTEPKYPIRLKKNEEVKRYTTFKFTKVISNIDDLLWYSVIAEREVLDSDPLILHHNVCFSKKGFLIITGMTYRDMLLKYLTELLHPKKFVFQPKYFSKKEIQDFTKKILKKDVNTIYRPRFHFAERYRKREFNDFVVGGNKCATEDSEYSKMMEKCHYFEPIFQINKI